MRGTKLIAQAVVYPLQPGASIGTGHCNFSESPCECVSLMTLDMKQSCIGTAAAMWPLSLLTSKVGTGCFHNVSARRLFVSCIEKIIGAKDCICSLCQSIHKGRIDMTVYKPFMGPCRECSALLVLDKHPPLSLHVLEATLKSLIQEIVKAGLRSKLAVRREELFSKREETYTYQRRLQCGIQWLRLLHLRMHLVRGCTADVRMHAVIKPYGD